MNVSYTKAKNLMKIVHLRKIATDFSQYVTKANVLVYQIIVHKTQIAFLIMHLDLMKNVVQIWIVEDDIPVVLMEPVRAAAQNIINMDMIVFLQTVYLENFVKSMMIVKRHILLAFQTSASVKKITIGKDLNVLRKLLLSMD